MEVIMNTQHLTTLEQIACFLESTQPLTLAFSSSKTSDSWLTWTHCTLSGHATKKLSQSAYEIFGQTQYARLASISVSHLYNLRKSTSYHRQRRATQPNGQPGFLRVDTVHQGDQDGVKGLYHINAVDEVTQFEIVCSVERISEQFLVPALEQLLEQFPFSEYINQHVVRLLNKLLIEQTKSRPRHRNDNALAECKNGSIIRKHFFPCRENRCPREAA